MGLNIKNVEVERLAADVALLSRETKTEAIRRALFERRARLKARAGRPVAVASGKIKSSDTALRASEPLPRMPIRVFRVWRARLDYGAGGFLYRSNIAVEISAPVGHWPRRCP